MSDVTAWIEQERRTYADAKWSTPQAEAAHLAAVQLQGPQAWHEWAGNYIRRAVLFGLDSPQGRQALGKAIVTLVDYLESAVALYGPMPAPGVPSGELREWAS